MHSKKGDLNLSINAIVVLILAVTLLSLGLTFINKTFGGATAELGKSLQGISEDRKSNLKSKCQDDLCLESTSVTIPRNKKETILMILNNKLDCEVKATININKNECSIIENANPSAADCQVISLSSLTSQKVKSKTQIVVPLLINPKNNAVTTTYRYEISVDGPCVTGSSQNKMEASEYIDVIVE